MKNKIQIIESYSQEILEELPVDQEGKAAERMAFYQDTCHLEVELRKPSLVQELHLALNKGEADLNKLEQEMNEEILSHDGCSLCLPEEKNLDHSNE